MSKGQKYLPFTETNLKENQKKRQENQKKRLNELENSKKGPSSETSEGSEGSEGSYLPRSIDGNKSPDEDSEGTYENESDDDSTSVASSERSARSLHPAASTSDDEQESSDGHSFTSSRSSHSENPAPESDKELNAKILEELLEELRNLREEFRERSDKTERDLDKKFAEFLSRLNPPISQNTGANDFRPMGIQNITNDIPLGELGKEFRKLFELFSKSSDKKEKRSDKKEKELNDKITELLVRIEGLSEESRKKEKELNDKPESKKPDLESEVSEDDLGGVEEFLDKDINNEILQNLQRELRGLKEQFWGLKEQFSNAEAEKELSGEAQEDLTEKLAELQRQLNEFISRNGANGFSAPASPEINITNNIPGSADAGLLAKIEALEKQVAELLKDAEEEVSKAAATPVPAVPAPDVNPEAKAPAARAPSKDKKDAVEEGDSKWLKRLHRDNFRREHSYLFDKTVDKNGLNNLSLIREIDSQEVELHESGMAVFCFSGREGLVNLNQNIESARGAAKGRNPVMSMAKVVNPNGNNIPPEEYYLVFSSPQHGVSTTVVAPHVAQSVLYDADKEFRASVKLAAKIKALKEALEYLESEKDEDLEAGSQSGGEGSEAGDEGSEVDPQEAIRELAQLIEKAEASLNSSETDVWHKRSLDKNYLTRSEALEEALKDISEYDLEENFPGFSGEEWKEILAKEAVATKIDEATANQLRKRCAYEEVDANEKCEDLTYTKTERAQVISKVTAWSLDLRGKKQERFEKSLDAATMWSGKNPGLSYRRPHDNDDVASVVFTGREGGKGPYDGNDIMYLKIRGTTEADDYYVKVQVATAAREYEFYEKGKSKPKKFEVGDIIIDKATVFWRDKEGNHHPKPVSKLSDFSKKRYNSFNINAMSVTNGERKTAILFEGTSIPTISLAKAAEVSETKAAEVEIAFKKVHKISDRFDVVIKRTLGNKSGKWVAEGDGKTMYLRDLQDPENLTKISTKGNDADLFETLKEKGCDEGLIKSLTNESKKSFLGQRISPEDLKDRPFLKFLEKEVNPKAEFRPRHALTLSEQLRSKDDGAGTKGSVR